MAKERKNLKRKRVAEGSDSLRKKKLQRACVLEEQSHSILLNDFETHRHGKVDSSQDDSIQLECEVTQSTTLVSDDSALNLPSQQSIHTTFQSTMETADEVTRKNEMYINILGADALPTFQVTRKSIFTSFIPNLWHYLLGTEGLLPSWCIVDYKSRIDQVICIYLHGISDDVWQSIRIHPQAKFTDAFQDSGFVYLQPTWDRELRANLRRDGVVEPFISDRMHIIQWDTKMLRELFYLRHDVRQKKRPNYSTLGSTIESLRSSNSSNSSHAARDSSLRNAGEVETDDKVAEAAELSEARMDQIHEKADRMTETSEESVETLAKESVSYLKTEVDESGLIKVEKHDASSVEVKPSSKDGRKREFSPETFLLSKDQLQYHDFPCLEEYQHFITLPDQESSYHMIAIDCEMCETSVGKELTRVSIIDHEHRVVYDELVRPEREIINYYTQYSGITAETLEKVTTTLKDVQAYLLKTFSKNTIIVGHSLENDLKALELVHERVIDTSVSYPHGNPRQKHKLKNLCKWWLGREIQVGGMGHDSVEDACAAMELIQRKIKFGERFGESRSKEENFIKLVSNKVITLVDERQDLRYIVNGMANSLPSTSDDDSVEKIVQAVRRKKSNFTWGHFHDAEKWYMKNAKPSEKQELAQDVEARLVKNLNAIYDVAPNYSMICILGTPEMYTLFQTASALSKCREEEKEEWLQRVKIQNSQLTRGSFAHFCIKGSPLHQE